jgi:hypothetical protein
MRRTRTLVFGDILLGIVYLLDMVVKGSSAALPINLEMAARIVSCVDALTDE